MDFYWADPHFNDEGMIVKNERPFSSVNEMDEYYIDRINSKVGERDRLWILGDFCNGANKEVEKYRRLIRCSQVCLITGNHDKVGPNNKIFAITKDLYDYHFKDDYVSQFIVMCHYPMKSWNKLWYGSWCLHGHSHGFVHPKHEFQLDIGVDCFPDGPLSFYEIYEIMRQKRIDWLRHHGPLCNKGLPDWAREEELQEAFKFLRKKNDFTISY